jgi:hypothetical protein
VCDVLRRLRLCLVFAGVSAGCFFEDALFYAEVKFVSIPEFPVIGSCRRVSRPGFGVVLVV